MNSDDRRPGTAGTVVGVVLAGLIGFFVGVVGTMIHRQWGPPVPLGLIVGLALVACVVAGLRLVFDSRVIAAGAGLGVLAAIFLFALPGPSGSSLVIDDALGWSWSIGAALIAAIVLVWPRPRRSATPAPTA